MAIFPSTLIISAKPDISSYLTKLQTGQPDLFIIDSDHSINQIRQLKLFFSQKPYSHQNKLAIIYQADQLNLESQNALLKTLEEPGPNNYLILITPTLRSLLPTIISRCQIVRTSSKSTTTTPPLKITGNLQTDLLESEKISQNKETILPFLKDQLHVYHQLLKTDPSPANSQIIKKLITAIKMIESNVDPRSALDYFFLS